MSTRNRKEEKGGWVFGLYNNRPRQNKARTAPLRAREQKKLPLKFPMNRWLFLAIVVFFFVWIPYVNVNCANQYDEPCEEGSLYGQELSAAHPPFLRLTPLFDTDKALNHISELNSVSEVTINRGIFNILNVSVTERAPYAVWHHVDEPDNKFFVDKQGVGYAPYKDNDRILVTFVDEIVKTPDLGEGLVGTDVLEYVLAIKQSDLLPGYLVNSAILTEAIKEVTVVLTEIDTQQDVSLKLSTLRGLDEQVIDFRLTTNYLREKGRKYSYIDVRLQSNTVYK